MAQDPELAAADQAAREANELVMVARTAFFPRVHLEGELANDQYTRAAGYAPLFTRAAEVGATELIYDGGAAWQRVAATKLERDAMEADRALTAERVGLHVSNAFLDVARDRELLASAERYVSEHEGAVSRVEQMVNSDRGKAFDLQQVRARAVFARGLAAERRAELMASEGRFQEMTGAAASTLEVPSPFAGPGIETLAGALTLADASHPSVQAARLRLEASLASRRRAEAAFVPLFNAEARYWIGVDRNSLPGRNDEAYVGVNASFALGSDGSQYTAVRAARAEAERAAARIEAGRRDVREAVRVAWDRRAGVIDTLPFAEQSLKESQTVVEGFRAQYQSGQRTVLDLLRVQADAYSAETQLIELRFDRLRADYELVQSQGRLATQLLKVAPTQNALVSP